MIRLITLLLFSLWIQRSFAVTYTLVASGTWSSTSTWSPSGVPGVGDDVIFNFDPSTPLTLTVDGNYSINSLEYSGYGNVSTPGKITIITGTGIISLAENSSWTGGFISGDVQISVPTGKSFQLYAGGDSSNRKVLKDNALITNNGSIYWGGTGIFFENAAQMINNGTFVDNTDYNRLYRNDGNTSNIGFINNGTFEANSSECHLHAAFVNNGTININSGWVHSDHLLENNGTIHLFSSGASNHQFINYDGSYGTIEFHTNTSLEILGKGMAATVGNLVGSSGTLILANSGTSDATIIDQTIPTGILLDLSQAGRVTLNSDQSLVSNSGFAKDMDGTGSLSIPVGVTMTWSRGYIGGDVDLIVNNGGTLTISSADSKEIKDNGLLTNNGTVQQQATLGLSTSQVMIENNGVYNIAADVHFYTNAPLPLINNSGTFRKSAGSGTSDVYAGFTNSGIGIISSESGTLHFHQSITSTGTVKGNATLAFPSGQTLGGTIAPGTSVGTLVIQAPSLTLAAAIQIEVDGSSTDQLQVVGALTLSGASLTVSEAGSPLTPGLNANVVQASSISGSFSSTSFPSAGYNFNTSGSNVTISNALLPLNLTAFHGHPEGTANFLDWETAREMSTDRFDIERSVDGHTWETIGAVPASFRTDHAVRYAFLDQSPRPAAYYRLKMLDLDGSYTYSWTIELTRQEVPGASRELALYPNPCSGTVHASLSRIAEGPAEVTIHSMDGRLLRTISVDLRAAGIDVDLSDLTTGTFILSVTADRERFQGMLRKL